MTNTTSSLNEYENTFRLFLKERFGYTDIQANAKLSDLHRFLDNLGDASARKNEEVEGTSLSTPRTSPATDTLICCPFCKGEARSYKTKKNWWNAGCTNEACPVMPEVTTCYSEAVAIQAWNTRAPVSSEITLPIDKLKAIRDEIFYFMTRNGDNTSAWGILGRTKNQLTEIIATAPKREIVKDKCADGCVVEKAVKEFAAGLGNVIEDGGAHASKE